MRSFEAFVAQRYLKTRKKGAFVRVMVRFARWGIALGVFAMVIALALMNGFREDIQANLFSATAHFTVANLGGDLPDTAQALRVVRATPGVVAASPMRMDHGLLKPADSGAPPAPLMLKAVDPASAHGTLKFCFKQFFQFLFTETAKPATIESAGRQHFPVVDGYPSSTGKGPTPPCTQGFARRPFRQDTAGDFLLGTPLSAISKPSRRGGRGSRHRADWPG